MDWVFAIVCLTAGLIFVWSLAKGRRPLSYLFYFWIICFNFGPRTNEIFGLNIFYLEGISWIVFFMLLFRLNFFIFHEKGIFPKYTAPLFGMFLIGLLTAATNQREAKIVIEDFTPFLSLIPVFCIVFAGFKYLDIKIEKIIKIFIIGTAILTAGGVLFYFFPQLVKMFPEGLFTGESVLIDITTIEVELEEGVVLNRGGGSFWGQLLLSAYLLLLLFPIYGLRTYLKKGSKGWGCLLLAGAMITNILINGQRSVWAGFLLGIALYSFFKGLRGVSVVIAFIFILHKVLPPAFLLRFYSLFKVSDIAWAGRVTRYEKASAIISQHPFFGIGWGGSGWVHDVALQMSANLGLITTCIFFLWLRKLILNAFQLYTSPDQSKVVKVYLLSFAISIVAFLGPLLGESVMNYPHLMIPFWSFCAIVHNFKVNAITAETAENKN